VPRVALAERVHANAVDNLLASTEVFPMTAPPRRAGSATANFAAIRTPSATGGLSARAPGLPEAEATVGEDPVTWYEQAHAYTVVKWASLAPGLTPAGRRGPGHRRPHREERGAPEGKVLRQALFAWAFNPATRDQVPPPHLTGRTAPRCRSARWRTRRPCGWRGTVGIPLTPSPSVPVRDPHGPRNQGCTDVFHGHRPIMPLPQPPANLALPQADAGGLSAGPPGKGRRCGQNAPLMAR
jgi:hypothetical protein